MHSHDRPPRAFGRRTLLSGAAALAAAAVAACTSTSNAPVTVTVQTTSTPAVDPMAGLVATTRLHVLRLNSAIAASKADPDQVKKLSLVRDDRKTQFGALVKEWERTDPSAAGAAAGADLSANADLPPEAKSPLGAARDDLAAARSALTDALAVVSRYRATILASVLAGVASDQAVLG